jgi:NAD(P)H dehydrogenase (quinone)
MRPLLTLVLLAHVLGLAHAQSVSVLITYYSRSGHTAAVARAVEAGARSVPHVAVRCRPVSELKVADVRAADAIIVGSPVYNAGMAAEVKAFIDTWPLKDLKDKVGAAFCTAGGTTTGAELTLMGILESMLVFQFVVVGGETWRSAFGATAINRPGPEPSWPLLDPTDTERARALGARVAHITTWLSTGKKQRSHQ